MLDGGDRILILESVNTTLRRFLALALVALPSASGAQVGADFDRMTPAAIAESLKVLKALAGEIKTQPQSAPLQYRKGRVALAIILGADWRGSRGTNTLDRSALNIAAADGLSEAIKLDGNNVEYLLTWATFLTATPTKQNQDAAGRVYQQIHDILKSDPDPARRANLLLRQGEQEWYFYNKYRLDDAPMSGFKDPIPDRPDTGHSAEPARRPGSAQENTRPIDRSAGTGTTAMSASDASARAAMAAETRPNTATLSGGSIPQMTVGSRNVSTELAPEYFHGDPPPPLPRALAVASRRAIEQLSRHGEPDIKAERHFLSARQFFGEAYEVVPADARAWRDVSKTRVELDQWPEIQKLAEQRVTRARDDPWGWFALGLASQRLHKTVEARIAFDSGLARMSATERAKVTNLSRLMRPSAIKMYAGFDSTSRARYDDAAWMLADPLWSENEEDPRTEFYARIAHAEIMWGKLAPRVYGADTPDGQRMVRYGPPVMRLNNIMLYPGGLIFAEGGERPALQALVAADADVVRKINEWQPARWDNVSQIEIDSMPVQSARFRATEDSVDFFVATRAPAAKLDSVAPANTHTFAKFWMYGWNTPTVVHDSLALSKSGAMQWTRRLPVGLFNYRVEAIAPGTRAAARAASDIMVGTDSSTGFAMRGFGMSDLLLAAHTETPTSARRWSDIDFTPLTGSIQRGGEASVIWENYEVGQRDGSAEYHVAMTLVSEELFTRKVSMSILAGIASAVKRKETANRLTLDFDRLVPHSAVVLDNLTLSFGNTPEGSYLLTVAVTDKATGRTTSRQTRLTIR